MRKLSEFVKFISGSPQFRIRESFEEKAPIYTLYNQADLSADLGGIRESSGESKKIRTFDEVNLLHSGDLVFSLISGTACIVGVEHESYLFTQNYIKLIPSKKIDKKFLVYLLNEDKMIRKQFLVGLQGTIVLKYTLRQMKELEIPVLPPIEEQILLGDVHFKTLRVEALKKRVARYEKILILAKIRERGKE